MFLLDLFNSRMFSDPSWKRILLLYFLGQECLAGTVKYVGKVNGKPGTWAGVALQEPGMSK